MAWIKLVVHPEHDKILALADSTGTDAERVFAAVVRWFRWVDEHGEGENIAVTRAALRAVTRWPNDSLADGMLSSDIDWLTQSGGKLAPTRFETHFGQSAKRRAMGAERQARFKAKHRGGNAEGNAKGNALGNAGNAARGEEIREECARAPFSRGEEEKPPDRAVQIAQIQIGKLRERTEAAMKRQRGIA